MATVTPAPPTPIPARVSVSDYLDLEWSAEQSGGRKQEYVDGEVREMPGGTEAHNLIVLNVGSLLRFGLKGRPFAAYSSDMRVRGGEEGPYYYPDVAVAPYPAQIHRERGDTLLNPVALFEVLSPTTQGIDRGEKLAAYGSIPTLADYVLVAQDRVRVDHFSRQPDGSWRLVLMTDLAETLHLPSVATDLPLAEIYDRVFPVSP